MQINSSEDAGWLEERRSYRPEILCERYAGKDVVGWYGRIERQLADLATKYEENGQKDDAAKVSAFLKTWRGNEITGSINREVLDVLKAGSEILAVDSSFQSTRYFSALRDSIRKLIADAEELPPMGAEDSFSKPAGSMGGNRPAPQAGMFPAQKTEPTLPATGDKAGAPGEQATPPGGEASAPGVPPQGQPPQA